MGGNKYVIGFTGRLETPKINFTSIKMACERVPVAAVVISILLQGTNLGFICSLKKNMGLNQVFCIVCRLFPL